MSEHKVLTFEALQASVVPEEWVAVPEWGEGAEVFVRGLTPAELMAVNGGKVVNTDDRSDTNALLLAAGVREPKLTVAQWKLAEQKLATPYLRVLQVVRRLSGLDENAAEDAQKNSFATQG
jgi:hypothetical protein